jgi:hypothetical protein
VGSGALETCTTGNFNLAIGYNALQGLTTSNNNVAIGNTTLNTLTTGANNTYIGGDAGTSNITTGSKNTAIGQNAGNHNFSNTTCIGYDSVATAANQIVLGTSAETTIIKGDTTLGSLGSQFKSVHAFLYTTGSSGSNNQFVSIPFGRTYPDASKLLVNVTINNAGGYSDIFVASLQSVSTTAAGVRVYRVDSNGGWGANNVASVIVFQKP